MSKAIKLDDIKAFGYATEKFVTNTIQEAVANLPSNALKTADPCDVFSRLDERICWYFKESECGDDIPFVYAVVKYKDEYEKDVYIPADYKLVPQGDGNIYVYVLRNIADVDLTAYIYSDKQPYYGTGM